MEICTYVLRYQSGYLRGLIMSLSRSCWKGMLWDLDKNSEGIFEHILIWGTSKSKEMTDIILKAIKDQHEP